LFSLELAFYSVPVLIKTIQCFETKRTAPSLLFA